MKSRRAGGPFAVPSLGMERLLRAAHNSPESGTMVVGAADPASRANTNWRDRLPVLRSGKITLRELQTSDAQTLWAFINSSEVTKFLSPPPATVDGFERFIAWTHRQRTVGVQASFAVVVEDRKSVV